MKSFAQRLRYAMGEAGLNQAGLAERAGAPPSAISQYLAGKNIPSRPRIEALAAATGVSVEFLDGDAVPEDVTGVQYPTRKISVPEAARCLGKSQQFIRVGLQTGRLPFGCAVQLSPAKWTYDIRPSKFREYVGDELFNAYFGRQGAGA